MNLVNQTSADSEARETQGQSAKSALIAFMADPKAYDYAEVTVNLCGIYCGETLSDEERRVADDILRQLSKSMEVRIRKALADHLKESVVLPHDIACDLARDIETVALPMLEFSSVLTDQDLIKDRKSVV